MDKKNKRKELEEKINAKAWKDPEFFKKLLSGEKSAHEALKGLGIELPKHVKVKIIPETKEEWCIVIHNLPVQFEQMTEKELKDAAAAGGGSTWSPTCAPCPCICAELSM